MLNTPVLFLIFNRPDLTARVFEAIRTAQPAQLFVAADGPRTNKDGEAELCANARNAVLNHIDWPCEVKTLFRDENLGCKMAVSSAITWFFEHVEEGIILEDDCLPSQSFFRFCEAMLERYRADESVMNIGSSNFQQGQWRGEGDYYFSIYSHIWGWATWKRAWHYYDPDMADWPIAKSKVKQWLANNEIYNFWYGVFEAAYHNKVDNWDSQWLYIIWLTEGKCILPNKNLVENIGFGVDATHTKGKNPIVSKMKAESLSTFGDPLKAEIDIAADNFTFYTFFSPQARKITVYDRVWWKVDKILEFLKFSKDKS